MSTEIKDCNANLEGLSTSEIETLRDWKARFSNKYPIVGKIVSAS
jgi:membrane-associated progesterone receptor component